MPPIAPPPEEQVESHAVAEEGPALAPPWANDEEYKGNTDAPIENARTVTFWIAIVAGAFVAAALLAWISTSVMSRNDGPDSFAPQTRTRCTAQRA